jgi:predicted CoA-substrate-specific enzyme activase
MLSLGIDSGSTMTKAVLFDGSQIVKYAMHPTGANPKASVEKLYQEYYGDDVGYVVVTGYGRDLLKQADKKVTEITCHAKGAAFLHPNTGMVIDVGGQDSKVIVMDENHQVVDFLMNDKCAAGTGRFVEMMMQKVEQPIEEIDAFTKGRTPVEISSMCAVFAESEIVSHLASGQHPGDIALGAIHSISRRVAVFSRKLERPFGDIFFTGGLAFSQVVKETLESYLQCEVYTHELSQYAGAIGAAILAYEKGKK